MNVIKINNLTKKFNHQIILRELELTIPQNSVFLLLGLNGEGKTTLLKILLGLLKYENGEISIGNDEKHMGCLIETPQFYDSLTAYENLKHHAILNNYSDEEIIKSLQAVHLNHENNKSLKKYSLGMKQRLGIARAILGDPNIILLDEPLNGLDPAGINDINQLILRLHDNPDKTIVLSSHLIKEAENLATDFAILHNGQIAIQFSKSQFESAVQSIQVTINGTSNIKSICENIEHNVPDAKCYSIGQLIRVYSKSIQESTLFEVLNLVSNESFVIDVHIVQGTLEELFLAITKGVDSNVTYN